MQEISTRADKYNEWINFLSTECQDSPNFSELMNYISQLKKLEEENI